MNPTAGADSDEALLSQYRSSRSEEARESIANRLFERHYERVGRWCYRFTGERESAADLAQEVFLKAHRHLDSFQGTAQFATWLYSIARNESISRSRRNGPATETEELLAELPSPLPDPETIAADRSSSRRLHDFLSATLEETERTVFTLHYGDDMSLDAIGRLLDLQNRSGAKAYIVSARRKLGRAVERMFALGTQL
jgi:RNA polymerase sigma-70 factor (ECF subfamily)